MTFLALLPVGLSILVLAAHFYRAGEVLPFAATLLLLTLTAVPRRWAARVLQAALLLGAVEWLRTAATFVAARQAAGRPWVRLAAILGSVAAVSALSALLFRTKALRERYRPGHREPGAGGQPETPS